MSFQVGGNEKELKKGWRYILWNGTCYRERINICALENVYVFSQTFMGLEEIP
jgi:hypothetical protein